MSSDNVSFDFNLGTEQDSEYYKVEIQDRPAPYPEKNGKPNNIWIITASFDKTAIAWDATTGEKKITYEGYHQNSLTSCEVYVPNNKSLDPILITSSIDKTCICWNLFTGEIIRWLKVSASLHHYMCFDEIIFIMLVSGVSHTTVALLSIEK